MYKEAGPVIETPLAGAESIHDILLQSRGSRFMYSLQSLKSGPSRYSIRRGQKEAFLLAAQEEGRTAWIHICSLAGEPCRIVTDMATSGDDDLVIDIGESRGSVRSRQMGRSIWL